MPHFWKLSLALLLSATIAKAETSFEYQVGSDVPPSARRQLISVFGQASRYFRTNHNITLPNPVAVLAGRDLNHLSDMLAAHPLGPSEKSYAMAVINQRCGNTELGALQFTGVIVVCLPRRSTGALTLDRAKIFGLKKLAVHELAHEVQAQLGAHPRPGEAKVDYFKRVGPSWLVEGLAMAFEFHFQAPEITRERWTKLLLGEMAIYDQDLKNLTLPGSVSSRNDYLLSAIAGQLALKDRALEVILDYWRLLGEGIPAQDAFQQAFGRSMVDVEQAVAALKP